MAPRIVGQANQSPVGRPFPTGAAVLGFAVHGGDSPIVIAATTAGIVRSDDAGHTWVALGIALPAVPCECVALSPHFTEDCTMYVVGGGQLHRSRDGGLTWQALLGGSHVLTAAVGDCTHRDVVVIAGTESDGVFRSGDGGESWEGVNPGLLDLTVLDLALSPAFATDKTVFLGTPSGLYRSRNGGYAWRAQDLPVDDPAAQVLAVSPGYEHDGTVLVGTVSHGLLMTRDRGRTWMAVPALGGGGVTAVACADASLLAAATDEGIAVSDDGGATWRMTGRELGTVLSLAWVLAGRGDVLLAGPVSGGIVPTDDLGMTWRFAVE